MTKAMSPNSLANLMPPYGSPSGPVSGTGPAPSHGQTLIKWLNLMGTWSRGRIQAMSDDEDAPLVKRQAAKSLLRSMHDDFAKSVKPLAMDDLHLHLDYTDGKPVQRVEVARVEVADPAALRVRLMEALAASPGLLASLTAAGVLPGVGGSDAGEGGSDPAATGGDPQNA